MQTDITQVDEWLDIRIQLTKTVTRFGERQQRVCVIVRLEPIRVIAEINVALIFESVPGIAQRTAQGEGILLPSSVQTQVVIIAVGTGATAIDIIVATAIAYVSLWSASLRSAPNRKPLVWPSNFPTLSLPLFLIQEPNVCPQTPLFSA